MKLQRATDLAMTICQELEPLCERIAVAGSIRRARSEVSDIDLVVLPKPGQSEAIKGRCQQRCRVIADGPQNSIYTLRLPDMTTMQLDIFVARGPSEDLFDLRRGNFGTLLLCRTGSREHNIYLIERAKKLGLCWRPYQGLLGGGEWVESDGERRYVGGKVVASEEEEDIFSLLELPFIKPEDRER